MWEISQTNQYPRSVLNTVKSVEMTKKAKRTEEIDYIYEKKRGPSTFIKREDQIKELADF